MPFMKNIQPMHFSRNGTSFFKIWERNLVASISIIIPAYNRAGLIGETLRSLLNQTVQAREIIVVDDGSQDGTAETVLEILKLGEVEKLKISEGNPWPEFKVIRQDNAGPGAARNRGLREATGEFIHFFDSDDMASPNKHEVQLLALLETGADIAYGPWVKGRFLPTEKLKHGKAETLEMLDPRRSTLDSGPGNFVPEGPVLQARGWPDGDLLRALLTNWSIVPHACLFRRSILEKAGGFPEDIWVGEDQLLFLRCLLAGAKVVHTPETMIFYRVGDDPGKLTASGAAQKRHARDWARFLLRANQEVTSDEWRVVGKTRCVTTENTEGTQGDAQGTCSCSSKSDYLPRELADSPVSESLTRSASGPASSPATSQSLLATASQAPLPATSYSLPVTTPPAEWYGFRLRAYEAWRDLEKFFPGEENELKENLERIFLQKRKFRKTEILKYQAAGFLLRKLGGLRFQVLGYRENTSFRCGKFSVLGGERCVAVNQKN